MSESCVLTVDDFLADPLSARSAGLAAPYVDWPGPDGETYKRVCLAEVPGVQAAIEKAMGRAVEMLGMGYSLNFAGELPNAAIHSDMGWGTHALVLYLSDGTGGTAFWRHKETGAARMEPGDMELYERVRHDWDDESKWEMVELARIQFNRAILYESALFHSRYPFAAFGTGYQDGRLIVVAFFN